jgi:hypothetical protein
VVRFRMTSSNQKMVSSDRRLNRFTARRPRWGSPAVAPIDRYHAARKSGLTSGLPRVIKGSSCPDCLAM